MWRKLVIDNEKRGGVARFINCCWARKYSPEDGEEEEEEGAEDPTEHVNCSAKVWSICSYWSAARVMLIYIFLVQFCLMGF